MAAPGRFTALVLLAACGGGGEPPPAPIAYPAIGSLSQASGKGSFRLGASSAATQIEDGNTNTDWWYYTAPVAMGGLGIGTFIGDAAGGFTRAVEDTQFLVDMKLDSYRFSIEWARVEPTRDVWDEAAIAHYVDQINALRLAGIRPMITLHHFSNPVWIDDPRDKGCIAGPTDTNLCGLGHPTGGPLVIAEMAEFAGEIASRLGDRVDEWGTLNEPVNYLLAAHLIGYFPPGKNRLGDVLGEFIPVVRDYLSAHAAMYAAIKASDLTDADGDGVAASVGLTLSVAEWVPASGGFLSDAAIDVAARDKVLWIYHYLVPEALRQGKFDTDLDGVLDEDQPSWKGTLDWLGVQYYFRAGVTGSPALLVGLTPCFGDFDLGSCVEPIDPSFCVPTMRYEYHAEGLFSVLDDFGKRWPDLPMIVTEAGIATTVGERRAENVVRTLEQIDRARVAGHDVRGYYHWSLYDNFEWAEGFVPRFGLYTVDYTSYERTPTLGATVLGEIAGARVLSTAQRKLYGGSGPMSPEEGIPDTVYSCAMIGSE